MAFKKHFTLLLLIIVIHKLPAQEAIPFIEQKPIIDGIADKTLPLFQLQTFNDLNKSKTTNPDINTRYYLAYGLSFLYVYIEADADNMIIRDRAYQNGDGFHLMIGKSQEDGLPTDEFYVLAFSPEDSWQHKIIWQYNNDLGWKKLGADVEFKTRNSNNKISFELLIPWKSVIPYHPFLTENIGLNLCFVKAINEIDKNQYFIKKDKNMQSAQLPKKYVSLKFEPPIKKTSLYSLLIKKNIPENEFPFIRITGFSDTDTIESVRAVIYSGENAIVTRKTYKIRLAKGINNKEILLNEEKLISGGYKIILSNNGENIGEHYISVFPNLNIETFKKRLLIMKLSISEATYNTLLFYINELMLSYKELKDYESSYGIRFNIAIIDNYLNQLAKNNDLIASRKSVYRRAFLSQIDSTLRPYSIYIPKNYSMDKKYPLLVYLHGSGDDDRALFYTPKIKDGFIILAPNGRGTSNCYSTKESQINVVESIKDVINNYNVDTNNVILSGFSMGGYGVYRIYYEHPELFKAIAIISGHPNLAQQYFDETELNFLENKNLKKFKKIPIYIFHGKKDMNCPFELTEKIVKKLEGHECNVTFDIGKIGHGMSSEDRENYYYWLKKQTE